MPEANNQNSGCMERAKECWQSNQPLEAGRLIYENLPVEDRPLWAARILRLALEKSGADRSHFERILDTVDHPRQWGNGHRCFDILRQATLELDNLRRRRALTEDEEILAHLIFLAELVAKVTYNAVDPSDPFDENSGWRIAAALQWFTGIWNDEVFAKAAWLALSYGKK
jgi:hypothetical protein